MKINILEDYAKKYAPVTINLVQNIFRLSTKGIKAIKETLKCLIHHRNPCILTGNAHHSQGRKTILSWLGQLSSNTRKLKLKKLPLNYLKRSYAQVLCSNRGHHLT